MTTQEIKALEYDWLFWARPEQLPPRGEWVTWTYIAGRGAGKTRSGAEWVRWQVEHGGKGRLALIAPTAADARDVMVEGESGLLAISPAWNRPKYEPSKRRITWNNGAMATLYSADEPERLRGPQHDSGWCDEVGAWRYPDAWDMYQFGLRLGANPQTVLTTTPRPTPLLRKILAAPGTARTHGTTYDNRANLAPSFFQQIMAEYAGTRLGRQELDAEMLDDNPDALWKLEEMIEPYRVRQAPALDRIVVAIDPATTSSATSDETGIIVAGATNGGHLYILDDRSGRASPDTWARTAISAYHAYQANIIVAESNQGGEMVKQTLHAVDPNVPVKLVTATRGKAIRAEPIVACYEQGRGHHVGTFATLESQMCEWTPGEKSPDRMDALVWAATSLLDLAAAIPLRDEPLPTEQQTTIPTIAEIQQSDPFQWADEHS